MKPAMQYKTGASKQRRKPLHCPDAMRAYGWKWSTSQGWHKRSRQEKHKTSGRP